MLRQVGVWAIVGCVLLMGWGAAGAATPQRAVFRVSLTGTLTKDWTATRTAPEEGECTEVTTNTGRWKLTLATRAPSRIVAVGPSSPGRPIRLSPGVVRAIAGQASQSGSIRVEERGPRCVRMGRTTTCAPQRRSFRGASAQLTSPSRGIARFRPTRGASPARFGGNCPAEPAEIRANRTDLELADAPLSATDVFDRDISRFFITGNTEQVTTIEGDYVGRVTERVRWKLTFTRLR